MAWCGGGRRKLLIAWVLVGEYRESIFMGRGGVGRNGIVVGVGGGRVRVLSMGGAGRGGGGRDGGLDHRAMLVCFMTV